MLRYFSTHCRFGHFSNVELMALLEIFKFKAKIDWSWEDLKMSFVYFGFNKFFILFLWRLFLIIFNRLKIWLMASDVIFILILCFYAYSWSGNLDLGVLNSALMVYFTFHELWPHAIVSIKKRVSIFWTQWSKSKFSGLKSLMRRGAGFWDTLYIHLLNSFSFQYMHFIFFLLITMLLGHKFKCL